ncbi:DUF6053 domain-containing protein [Lysobacter yananisis]|uniref:DUF6053 domain-containing protein n=1 Tax=Lysobacter yananisis TaxID=1003114 RepID=UPI003CE4F373
MWEGLQPRRFPFRSCAASGSKSVGPEGPPTRTHRFAVRLGGAAFVGGASAPTLSFQKLRGDRIEKRRACRPRHYNRASTSSRGYRLLMSYSKAPGLP